MGDIRCIHIGLVQMYNNMHPQYCTQGALSPPSASSTCHHSSLSPSPPKQQSLHWLPGFVFSCLLIAFGLVSHLIACIKASTLSFCNFVASLSLSFTIQQHSKEKKLSTLVVGGAGSGWETLLPACLLNAPSNHLTVSIDWSLQHHT